jgi:type IV pilus assembly protein PilA
MLARIQKSMKEKDEGFTLIELLVVIIIIGILAAIAIPVFLNQRKKGWDAQAKSDARNLASLEETYFTDAEVYLLGNAAALSAAAPTGLDYKKSTNVSTVDVTGYDATGTKTTTAASAVGGFCAIVVSKSTAIFVYDSTKGGLQPSTVTTCP